MYLTPDRRRRRRYLTLKNAAIGGVALGVAFILLSVWSGLRPAHSGVSRNLLEPRVTSPDSPARHEPVAIIEEGSIDDLPKADSLLDGTTATHSATAPPIAASLTPAPPTLATPQETFQPRESQLGKGKRITISDGAGGVQLHVEAAPPLTQSSETATSSTTGQSPPV